MGEPAVRRKAGNRASSSLRVKAGAGVEDRPDGRDSLAAGIAGHQIRDRQRIAQSQHLALR